MALTEIWIRSDDNNQHVTAGLVPTGYSCHHSDREGGHGGGIALICRDSIKVKSRPGYQSWTFEAIEIYLTIVSGNVKLIVIYRPPSNSKNRLTLNWVDFEIADMIKRVVTTHGKLLIVGNF